MFPSPHSGILFLCCNWQRGRCKMIVVSVPSFGDSFFMKKAVRNNENKLNVSVPSFGDSFFIGRCKMIVYRIMSFPSPHSGILFLWCSLKTE